MFTWISAIVATLAFSGTLAVVLGRMISTADRVEGAPRWTIWCTGCGQPAVDRRVAGQAVEAQPEWSHGDDEDYCPDCAATRLHTWGYRT